MQKWDIPFLVPTPVAQQPPAITLATGSDRVRYALAADPHLSANLEQQYNGNYPGRNLREAVASILNAQVEGAIVNGDLAWDAGLPDDYAHLQTAIEPLVSRIPVAVTLGNHDNRPSFLARFSPHVVPDAKDAQRLVTVIEHGPVRFILLDSLLRTDIVGGLLGHEQRQWLQQTLETSDERSTLVAVHHPIGETDDRLLDSDRLLRIVERFPKVKGVISAHDHAYRIESIGRLKHICLPAIGMPFEPSEPAGWIEATLSATQCTLKFHALAQNRERDQTVTTLTWD